MLFAVYLPDLHTVVLHLLRHYYLKDVNIFIAEPGNKKAILALSALARAMKEMNNVAIVRCVWRQGQGNVVVGVLTPNVSDKNNTVSMVFLIFTSILFCFLVLVNIPLLVVDILIDHCLQPDSFYFNVLPFAEDVREFQFPSFSNLPSSMQPNEKQQAAADKLVQMLDLAPPGKQEVLSPDFTPNPVLEVWRHSSCKKLLKY